jgi:cobalt-zinc-cadmium efflux system protein
MIGVAAVALLLNTAIAYWLRGAARHSLNMRSAFLHMVGDALASAGVVVAGLIIYFTGWLYADPLVSVLIGLFIAYSSWDILVETVNVLLEGTPRGMDVDALAQAILKTPGVADMHDLHVWTIADGMHALSCHLRVHDSEIRSPAQVVQAVKALLVSDYDITHSTIETECDGCADNERYCCLESRRSETRRALLTAETPGSERAARK